MIFFNASIITVERGRLAKDREARKMVYIIMVVIFCPPTI